MMAAATVIEGAELRAAGGFVVQLLPEVAQGPLMVMTERLAADFNDLAGRLQDERSTPDALLDDILYGMAFTRLEQTGLRFECRCSQVRVVASLATLGREDILELIRPGEVLEIACDYCGKEYKVAPAQLRGLLSRS
jgi:molecular chaperone Hsp33